jgi:hypothetical protein
MRSQEAKNRKEKRGEEERRTSKLEPKIQVLVHLFLVLLLLLLLYVFSTHSLTEPDTLWAVAFAPASIVSNTPRSVRPWVLFI